MYSKPRKRLKKVLFLSKICEKRRKVRPELKEMSSESALAALGNISLRAVKVHMLANQVMVATIDRPRTRNALNDDVYNDLIQIMAEAGRSDDISCLVLTGRGDFFSSGQDLKEARGRTGKMK